jgi:hypothetical protein
MPLRSADYHEHLIRLGGGIEQFGRPGFIALRRLAQGIDPRQVDRAGKSAAAGFRQLFQHRLGIPENTDVDGAVPPDFLNETVANSRSFSLPPRSISRAAASRAATVALWARPCLVDRQCPPLALTAV